jgi:hypothetical protein
MLLRRVLTTFNLVLRLFSQPRVLTIAAFPFILWFLKRLFFGRTVFRSDIIVLLTVYALLLLGMFAWQFAKAAAVLSSEPRLRTEVEKLDVYEQNELRRLVHSGKLPVGPPTFDRIAAKTPFIYRHVSGEWRIEKDYKSFLRHWAKESQSK